MNSRGRMSLLTVLALLCTTAGLARIYSTGGWIPPVVGAILAAVGIAAGMRAARVPAALAALVSAGALLVYLTAVFTPGHAYGGLIPSPASLQALDALARTAAADVRSFATPVPPQAALVLPAAAGAWAVAWWADLCAVTLHDAAAAGVPLFALLAVPAALPGTGIAWPTFAVTAAAWLALLAYDTRTRELRWGTTLEPDTPEAILSATPPTPGAGPTVPGSPSRRIAATAIALAVIVPAALPLLPGVRTGGTGAGVFGAGTGPGAVTVVQPLATVASDLHASRTLALLRVKTNHPAYLQLTALDTLDGYSFVLDTLRGTAGDGVGGPLPRPATPPGLPGIRVTDTVRATSHLAEFFLPVPYAPVRVHISGGWRLSLPTDTIFTTHTDTQGRSWTSVSLVPAPSPTRLAASPLVPALGGVPSALRDYQSTANLRFDTRLPADLPPQVDTLLGRIVAGSTSTFEAVERIQNYLAGPLFTYSLAPPPIVDANSLLNFLTVRAGYCQQFATTMAIFVRMLGVPARVAVGFTPGTRGSGGVWTITNRDAHAWPEVYFPTSGWVRFEPTPAAAGTGDVPPYARPRESATTPTGPATPGGTSRASGTTPGSARRPIRSASPQRPHLTGVPGTTTSHPARRHTATTPPAGTPAPALLAVVLVAVGALALATPATVRMERRRRLREALAEHATTGVPRLRGAGPAGGGDAGASDAGGLTEQVWQELLDTCADIGRPVQATLTPRLTAAAWAQLAGTPASGAAALAGLARQVEIARYSDRDPDLAVVRRGLDEGRAALLASARPGRRRLARFLPPSTTAALVGPVRTALTGLFDRLDSAPQRTRAWLADLLRSRGVRSTSA